MFNHFASQISVAVRTTLIVTIAAGSAHVAFAQTPAPQCAVAPAADQKLSPPLRQTVVVTDSAAMNNFSLARTLNTIVESTPGHSGLATEAERIALLQSLLTTFKETKFVNPDSNVALNLNTRPGEATLSPAKLLDPSDADGMHPVGLFNRLDLAPADFRNCGQHRIVYAKGTRVGGTNRFFLIFEAALDNPVDDADLVKRGNSCREVARFWDSLKDKSGPDLAAALEDFYYKGLAAKNYSAPAFKPVVQFAHYGTPDGQVRGNLFVTTPQLFSWELREWRLVASEPGRSSFAAVTVKDNPIAELYGARKASDPFDALQDPFKAVFVDKNEPGREQFGSFLQQLTAYDRDVIKSGKVNERNDELAAVVAMSVQNKFNDFQSVEGAGTPSPDIPAVFATQSDIGARITAKLTDTAACKITAEHILNRAGANSCAGCHEFSPNKAIAPGGVWPASLRFVHIQEDGGLSPALENEFLPARRRGLDRALVLPPVAVATAPSATALSLQTALSNVTAVRGTLQSLQSAGGSRLEFLEGAAKLERQVIQSRELERAQLGAFVQIRREH